MKHWSLNEALKTGRAKTRDGRHVVGLHKAAMYDPGATQGYQHRVILVGCVSLVKRLEPGWLKTEKMYWHEGGLGSHGGDDLVNYK